MTYADRYTDIHKICPLDFILEILHLATEVGREDLEYPSVGVLICHRPISIRFDLDYIWRLGQIGLGTAPVEVEHDQLPFY